MGIQIDYVNIKIPIFRYCRKKSKKLFSPVIKNISIGNIVMTNHGWDIGIVTEISDGKPTKILAKCNGVFPLNPLSYYGGIETVEWYNTGINISIPEWIKLSKQYNAEEFYKYWKDRIMERGEYYHG